VKLFDSHLHLTDGTFRDELPEVLERARLAGVQGMVTIASDPDDAVRAIDLARKVPSAWCSVGLHPHAAEKPIDTWLERIRMLAAEPEAVAIGETGLDFHYENAPRAQQMECFEAQLELATTVGLPVVVHSREADADTARLVRRNAGRVAGVLHCFTGGPDLLDAALDAGWYVSFSGIVTFGKFEGVDSARRVPADRLLIETDSPYLAPVPKRGRRNEPAFLAHTCAAMAALRGTASEELAEQTFANAARFYGLEV
jgi:TatD DNase family protein